MFEINDIQTIINIILILAIIYLLFFKKTAENFEETETAIINAVNTKYTADIDAIRNLGQVAKNIMTNTDNLILPTNITVPGKLTINNDTLLRGNLTVDGGINFTRKDFMMLELFPRYMIMAWYGAIPKPTWINNSPPLGWAICDGRRYIINTTTNVAESVPIDNPSGVLTPDLRGRFVIGAGDMTNVSNNPSIISNSNTEFGDVPYEKPYNFNFGQTGGINKVTLTIPEMPAHNHNIATGSGTGCTPIGRVTYYDQCSGASVRDEGIIKSSGENKAHNNMPPYYALYYIMKI